MPVINLQQPTDVLGQARRNSELRANFLRQYEMLDAEKIHDMCGSTAINKAALAGGWKKSGRIFSVEYKNRQLYPAFQFEDGRIIPVIIRILKALGPTMGPWQTAMWFTTKNPDLLKSPVELLKKDPDSVVEAAKKLSTDNHFSVWYLFRNRQLILMYTF